ncbi:MAG: hypothetical protein IPL88_02135 [Rhizobiales bacterium]|nr:hypothetical protein [Hyphomicrobiales bacterium]
MTPRWLWLVAIPALYLADLGVAGRVRLVELAHDSELRIASAEPGARAAYAGREWRVAAARIFLNSPPDPRLDMPRDARLLFVRVDVADIPALRSSEPGDCRVRIEDATGRLWAPSRVVRDFRLRQSLSPQGQAPGCAALAAAPGAVGFEETFALPPDAKAPLALRISTQSGRPDAIRLRLAPAADETLR